MTQDKYYDWEILDELPKDWIIDKTAGSPVFGTVFITNGKSVINGQKRALLRVKRDVLETKNNTTKDNNLVSDNKTIQQSEAYIFPAKTVNELARLKFKEYILKEILFDLMVCEIEGWDKKVYISELKKMLNSINISKKKQVNIKNTQNLFNSAGI